MQALRQHHRQLLAERERLDRLAHTVDSTIVHLEAGTDMTAEEIFDGFPVSRDALRALESISVERHGAHVRPYFEAIRDSTAEWTPADYRAAERKGADTELRLLTLLKAGIAPDDPRAFAVLDDDYADNVKLWNADPDSYAQLGRAFAESPELRVHLDARHPKLAEYLRDAMTAYAATRMPAADPAIANDSARAKDQR